MRRHFLALALLFALAAPTFGQAAGSSFITCPQSQVNANLCASTSDGILALVFKASLRTAAVTLLADARGYQETVPCSQERVTGVRGTLVEAGVTQSDCLVGELGTTVDNPQTREDFLHRMIYWELAQEYKRHAANAAAKAASDGVLEGEDIFAFHSGAAKSAPDRTQRAGGSRE